MTNLSFAPLSPWVAIFVSSVFLDKSTCMYWFSSTFGGHQASVDEKFFDMLEAAISPSLNSPAWIPRGSKQPTIEIIRWRRIPCSAVDYVGPIWEIWGLHGGSFHGIFGGTYLSTDLPLGWFFRCVENSGFYLTAREGAPLSQHINLLLSTFVSCTAWEVPELQNSQIFPDRPGADNLALQEVDYNCIILDSSQRKCKQYPWNQNSALILASNSCYYSYQRSWHTNEANGSFPIVLTP